MVQEEDVAPLSSITFRRASFAAHEQTNQKSMLSYHEQGSFHRAIGVS